MAQTITLPELGDCKIFTENIEPSAMEQIKSLLSEEAFKGCKVRIMPDVHAGASCVIGFTANLGDKVIPNLVGVDIGCGMHVIKFDCDTNIDLETFDKVVRLVVPAGNNVFKNSDWSVWSHLKKLRCYSRLRNLSHLMNSIGTLGGGNHFIELDKDNEGNTYMVIHSGSRNLGKQVCDIYQDMAYHYCFDVDKQHIRNTIDTLKREGRQSEIEQELKKLLPTPRVLHKDMAYLEGVMRENYLHDMALCQRFAELNRHTMAANIINVYGIVSGTKLYVENSFETIHNYIDFSSGIIRKGAISCNKGERVIIPMNMRDGSLICIGKGNEDWNCSAPHGAGRIMSRKQARETLRVEDFKQSMAGIYTTTVNENTIDEAPMVYKPMKEIVRNIEPTATIETIIKPIYNFKAEE